MLLLLHGSLLNVAALMSAVTGLPSGMLALMFLPRVMMY